MQHQLSGEQVPGSCRCVGEAHPPQLSHTATRQQGASCGRSPCSRAPCATPGLWGDTAVTQVWGKGRSGTLLGCRCQGGCREQHTGLSQPGSLGTALHAGAVVVAAGRAVGVQPVPTGTDFTRLTPDQHPGSCIGDRAACPPTCTGIDPALPDPADTAAEPRPCLPLRRPDPTPAPAAPTAPQDLLLQRHRAWPQLCVQVLCKLLATSKPSHNQGALGRV